MASYDVVRRPAQPYAAIPVTATMTDLGEVAPPLNTEVFAWVAAHGGEPDGPPFWRYEAIEMPWMLQLDVGVTTSRLLPGDDRVVTGELPAGSYLQTVHRGHPDSLERATGDLLAHAAAHGLTFDLTGSPEQERWVARLELYLTDPAEEPDLDAWETLLAFKLAD